MDKVPQMTEGRVSVGSGTLYNLLEQFVEAEMIQETKAEGRKRSYILTNKGREVLKVEYERLQKQMTDYEQFLGEEDC